jgi:molybdenum cofactor biosynthesis enzyme
MPPYSEFPQYERIKQKMLEKGEPLAAAKTSAAKITNSRGGKVPPSHPRSRTRP